MKQIKQIFLLPMVALLMTVGCTESTEGFLDDKAESLTLAQIFADSLKTQNYVATVYWQIPSVMYAPRRAGWYLTDFEDLSSAVDDGREVLNKRDRFCPAFMKADFSQNGINADFEHFMNAWTAMYSNIRICNQVLENIDGCPLTDQTREGIKLEIRFLRAFYYFHLLRNFGGVPLVGDNMLSPFENYDLTRATFEETVNYIASELDYLVTTLPEEQKDEKYGRPTKGAALAMLAKLYHYAASPLTNGGNTGSGENRLLVGYDDYQKSRWQKAKDAIENFYRYNEATGYYGLEEVKYTIKTDSLKDDDGNVIKDGNGKTIITVDTTTTTTGLYTAVTSRSTKEKIWFWLNDGAGGNSWPHKQLLPKSRAGDPKIVPYHELAEAFPTKDGKDIRAKDAQGKYYTAPGVWNTNNKQYNPDKPYEKRDPRFYCTILYNGVLWRRTTNANDPAEPIWTYDGAQLDGTPNGGGSPTGYYYNKMCKTNVLGSNASPDNQGMGISFIRYADILLMDAEIMTELDLDGYRTQIDDCLFAIRQRSALEPGADGRYGISADMNYDDMIDFIINERRIEFVIEAGNRFWDLQRRQLLMNLNRQESHAARWVKTGTGETAVYSWTMVPIERHYVQPKMYHLPIPLKEVGSSKGRLLQNPGW
ncbi:membrane protein [Bacteroidia bacterium]|nr:membrane protein [Bacteroidia bacterium]